MIPMNTDALRLMVELACKITGEYLYVSDISSRLTVFGTSQKTIKARL